MDHLAQDLSVALEETESCGPMVGESGGVKKWGMRRRTRSAGNLHLFFNKPCDHSDDSSSSPSERRADKHRGRLVSFHQSDSDDMSCIGAAVARALHQRNSLRSRHPMTHLIRGVSYSLESDSVNEHSPARPNLRRKRKLKRMSIDETPTTHCGKRKRPQRHEIESGRSHRHSSKIAPLNQKLISKIEKFCNPGANSTDEPELMEAADDSCDVGSESSVSLSGSEGHDGDDELTDWAPSMDKSSMMDQSWHDSDPREIRAGCRRVRDERPGFSISTAANKRVAKFLQDTTKSELRVFGAEREKLGQLAALYSLDLWFETPSTSVLKKTTNTPCMQPTQRHRSGLSAIHKKIRTQSHTIT